MTVLDPRPDGVYTLSRSIPAELAASFEAGDHLVVVQSTGTLLRIPSADLAAAHRAVDAPEEAEERAAVLGGVRDAGGVERARAYALRSRANQESLPRWPGNAGRVGWSPCTHARADVEPCCH